MSRDSGPHLERVPTGRKRRTVDSLSCGSRYGVSAFAVEGNAGIRGE